MDYKSALTQAPEAVVAILVKRLGGTVEITQAEFDQVAFDRLEETPSESFDSLTLRHLPRPALP